MISEFLKAAFLFITFILINSKVNGQFYQLDWGKLLNNTNYESGNENPEFN